MGLSQDAAARHLNVSRSVVHRLWNQYQTEAFVSRRHVPDRPRATTPAGDRFYCCFGPMEKTDFCATTCCRPLCSIREKNIR
ncbi:uncharacterized protein TNCV_2233351 [Trichonephila clavipes]|nr:uncharacterized protein TNCV_2233351 [Trichonephila clavipes]